MASGHDSGEFQLRSSQRTSKKRQFADFITHTPDKHETARKQKEQCKKCNELFVNKKSLASHEKKCLALTAQDSFGKHAFNKKPYDTSGKVIVSSQSQPPSSPPQTPRPSPSTPSDNATTTTDEQATKTPSRENTSNLNQQQSSTTTTANNPTSNHNDTPTGGVSNNITPNLPEYIACEQIPNKPYNNIEGKVFADLIDKYYNESMKFRKNLFLVPNGSTGKKFVALLSEWITYFNSNSTFHGMAMKVVMTLPNLLLQKPSAKSKAREHTLILEQRLQHWNEGNLSEIWKECQTIQKKLKARPSRSPEDVSRTFSKLMFEGKVGAALRFMEEQSDNAVLPPTDNVVRKLRELHPPAQEISRHTLIAGPTQPTNKAFFLSIDEQEIQKAANRTSGAAGPSMFDAKQWKHILVSKKFKKEGKDLQEAIAAFTRKLASEILDPHTLETYTTGRLIALNKAPGEKELQVRPIGVGEVLRRIVGKTISWCLSDEIQEAGGPLQVSTGLEGGAEAAIHSMKKIFEEEGTDAIILVDAANAFNRLNRQAALHNMQYLCPPFAMVLINTYRLPARLFLSGGNEISSEEGTTQGDALAMAFYGIGTKPILTALKIKIPLVKQVLLADDATGAGKLHQLKEWWMMIIEEGKKYGYFVKPTKSWLVLKNANKLEETRELFKDVPINITIEGKRHLGAAIGTTDFKNEYINEKVKKWCNEIITLSEIDSKKSTPCCVCCLHSWRAA